MPLAGALTDRGYPDEAVAGILGGNVLRLATDVWKPVGQQGAAPPAQC
jgi:microsomal dipeptidase-like Zn-dependent dipeptidase